MRIIRFIWGKEMRMRKDVRGDRKSKRGLRETREDLIVGCRSSLLPNLIKKIVLFKRKL